jgi:hypothetical protein
MSLGLSSFLVLNCGRQNQLPQVIIKHEDRYNTSILILSGGNTNMGTNPNNFILSTLIINVKN